MVNKTTSSAKNRLAALWRLGHAKLSSPYCPGVVALVFVLFLLSAAAGMQPDYQARLYVAGEVATGEVIAERNIQVEDSVATQARREQIARMQPVVFDLSNTEIVNLRQRIFDIFSLLNDDEINPAPEDVLSGKSGQTSDLKAFSGEHTAEQDTLYRLSELVGVTLGPEAAVVLKSRRLQSFMTEKGLPWLEKHLREGVVSDARSLRLTPGGILIRNVDNGMETLRPSGDDIRDMVSLQASFSQFLRTDSGLSVGERRMLNMLISAMLMPTLTINREATQTLGMAASQEIEPVMYRINKGEVIVHRGERVTREQQLKLQGLFRAGKTLLRAPETIGTFIVSLFISIGLFMSPSGRPSSPMRRRDLFFISFLVLFFGIAAKCLRIFAPTVFGGAALSALPFLFPVAAASGLAALVFAARRYCVTGLLVSLFGTLLFGNGVILFLFYFLAAMCNTWLVMRAQNRQDVVRNMLPLCACIIPLGMAAALVEGFSQTDVPMLLLCLCVNVALTQFIMFVMSPLLERVFGYTTRFRLMELSNLEQPLLQELMVSAPGTYHHSLVVSNLVEAGAKTIGANSLLCKVAGLYHDIGKLAYPEYFVENQFGGPNRHDRLAPAMSALILASHVKKGVELAVKYRLGDDIVDLIRQHHGTSIMKFFYGKAMENSHGGEQVRSEDFQYPGPRPQTREAALIMLADVVEASSRVLAEPTPARIRTHVETIIKKIFMEGQLDESELTFQDLHKLADSFARILTGVFHQRIAYPDIGRVGGRPGTVPNGQDRIPEISPAADSHGRGKPGAA